MNAIIKAGSITGTIVLWHGSIATIPGGWALCDGSNGTPMLIDSFIIAAGSGYPVDDYGGAVGHTHNVTNAPHNHDMVSGDGVNAGNDFNETTTSDQINASADLESNMPPYYALAYIMKL